MSRVTNDPGRCGFNTDASPAALTITGWNHDPESTDCLCVEWGLTGCDCEVCHSLRRLKGLCAPRCAMCIRWPRPAAGTADD